MTLDYETRLKRLEKIQSKYGLDYDDVQLVCDLTLLAKDTMRSVKHIVESRHDHAMKMLDVLDDAKKGGNLTSIKVEKLFAEFVEELDEEGREIVVEAFLELAGDISACNYLGMFPYDELLGNNAVALIRRFYLIASKTL